MTSRLKTIELQGYKTFANKVNFEFPLPITAIVGPNGSGKSNISDSIRWVLGEQSFSLLRGRKTMDMIFSGSDKKARAGMASATITFDNHDKWLPVDYEEVSITRRAFRDGQNEYLINGQKVRLKDVNELLAQSGLAERTYTIIGQGLIDNALSAKPEDRRRFFEEAAGIGLFRSRREEALTRLKDTHHNMERITDILSELEPRVRSLERQAKRAAEYDRVTGELKELLRDWYGYYWHKTQNDLQTAQERCRVQEERTKEVREAIGELEQASTARQEELRDARLALSELHNQSSAKHAQLDRITRDNAILDERLNSIQHQILNFNDESTLLADEEAFLNERRTEMEAELAEMESEAADAAAQKTHFEEELNSRQKELQELRQNLRDRRNDLSAVETSLIKVKARRDELLDRAERLSGTLPGLENSLERTGIAMRASREEYEKYQSISTNDENRLALLSRNADDAKVSLDRLNEQQRDLQREKSEAEGKLSKVSARLDVLEDAEKNLSGLNQGAQFLMKNAKQGRIRSQIRSLEGHLIVEKEYETAVAAALGDELDGLLIDHSEWDFVMDLLCSGNNGRAVLIPEKYESKHGIAKNASMQGSRPLTDVIRCDDAVRPLLTRILNSVYLAENRVQALLLQPELHPGEMLVTRSGDIFRADGSVVSGNEGRQQVLSRTREMHALRDEITGCRENLDHCREQLESVESELVKVRKTYDDALRERGQLQSSLDQVRKKLNQIAIEREKQKQTEAFQRQRLEESRSQITAAEEEKAKCDAEITGLEQKRDLAQAAIREAQDLVNRIQLIELQDQAHHWSVSCAVLQKSISEINTRLRENGDALSKNQNRQVTNRDRLASMEQQTAEIASQKENLQSEADGIQSGNEELTAKIAPAEVLVKEAESRLQESQETFRNYQQHVTSAERLLAQAQLDVTRMDDRLENLKKRIEDDFGLVNFSFNEQVSGQSTLPLGEMVAELPVLTELRDDLEGQIQQRKNYLRRMGAVNPEAIAEYKESSERYQFMSEQLDDLRFADADLNETIEELDRMMENAFMNTFEKVQTEFKAMFTRLFGGGSARLLLTDPDDVNGSGIEIEAKLPGHREQELSLLSGGERSLTSVALVFALLRVSPTPFCVMDEVDAALDEANVGRFCDLLKDLSRETQFIVITHNRNTVEASDVIYGITMASDSTSQVVSLKLDEVNKDILK